MSPTKQFRDIAENNGVSVKTLLTLCGLLMMPAILTVGQMIQLNVRLTTIEDDMKAVGASINATLNERKITFENRFDRLEAMAVSWTDRDMDTLQKRNQRAFDDAGIKVVLPDAFESKKVGQAK